MKELIAKIRNTNPFENLEKVVPGGLGRDLKKLVDAAGKADAELDLVHSCLTDVYNMNIGKDALDRIRECLDQLQA